MNIQKPAGRTFIIFFKYPWIFILSTLAAILLSAVTLGILAPVMWLGLGEMFIKANEGVKPEVEDIFSHLNRTITLSILGLLITLSVAIGTVVLIVPGIILAALWFYAPYYIVYNNVGILESLKLSTYMVNKRGLLAHVTIVVSIWLVLAIGFNTIIGIVLCYPLCAGFSAFLFNETREA